MTETNRLHLLHLDASARPGRGGIEPHGAWSRRLSDAFASAWEAARPHDVRTYRDLGAHPPAPVQGDWVQAAFTPPSARTPALQAALAESDALVAELVAADVLVIGMPMYNFGLPAPLKAWVDAVVRVGVTFDYRPGPDGNVYLPLLADRPRRAVLLTSRGGHGFDAGGALAAYNHADPALRGVLGFLGIGDVETIAIEHDEEGGARHAASVAAALAAVDALVARWAAQAEPALAT